MVVDNRYMNDLRNVDIRMYVEMIIGHHALLFSDFLLPTKVAEDLQNAVI